MLQKRRRIDRILFCALIALVLVHMIPVAMVVMNSLRSNQEVRKALFGFPSQLTFSNYAAVFQKGGYLQSYIGNFTMGFACIAVVLLVITMAAYGIVKMNARCGRLLTGYFTASMSIPTFGILIPLFSAYRVLGLTDSLAGIGIIFCAMSIPYNFLFIRAFFINIPSEIEEAARIDGASEWQTLCTITLPLARPMLLTSALIVFTTTWNNFQIPRIFMSSASITTVSLNYYKFIGEYASDQAYVYTAAVLSIAPILVLYLCMQKSFIEGMTSGAVKS